MVSGTIKVAAIVGVVLLLSGAVVAATALDSPKVEGIDNDWGTVTRERTEVETRIALDNPMLLRLGEGVANVEYAVSLNGIRMAHGHKRGVQLSGRRDIVSLLTWFDNSKIPRWWASHVNRNGTTTVRVEPDVVVEFAGIQLPAEEWSRNRTVRTDLLAPLETDRTRRLTVFDRTVLVVNRTDAHWGHATVERTPLYASAVVTNPTPVPIPITQIQYTIRMNGIVVGHGIAGEQTLIPPNATRTLEAHAVIDNSKLDEWWVTHIRHNETTTLSVDITAIIEIANTTVRVRLEALSYDRTFHTDIFADDGLPTNSSAETHRVATRRATGPQSVMSP